MKLGRPISRSQPLRKRRSRRGRAILGRFPVELPERDRHYEAWIRTLPCWVCGDPSQCHHQPGGDDLRALGRKVSSKRSIPLCPSCHTGPLGFHNVGPRFWSSRGIDPEEVIKQIQTEWREK